jgi:hypothetical protein
MGFVGNLLRQAQFSVSLKLIHTQKAQDARGRAIKAVLSQYCGGERGGEY